MTVRLFIEYHAHRSYVNCSGNCLDNNTTTALGVISAVISLASLVSYAL